jgi:hypothetical protein
VTRFAPPRDLHFFPFRPSTTKLIGKSLKLLYGRGRRT